MISRSRMLAATVAAALVAAAAAGCASSSAGTKSTSNDSPGLVLINTSKYKGNLIPSTAKPTTVMTADTTGKPYDIRTTTRGTVTLLYFGYTTCPDQCPLTMANTAAALTMLPKADQSKIRVLFVTVDPVHDTVARLRSWLGGFNPSFIGLRGTLAQIQAAAQQTSIPVGSAPIKGPDGTYAFQHGTEMLAYSTDNVAYEAFFPSTPPADMAHDLKLLVTGHHP